MLRKTASRAFAPGESLKTAMPLAPEEVDGRLALDRLFSELHKALEAEISRSGDAEKGPGLSLSRPRSRAEGVAFVLEGPRGAVAFVRARAGVILVHRMAGRARLRAASPGEGRSLPPACEVLALHPHWGAYRPISKPLEPGAPWPPGFLEGRRSGFAFTSLPELARRYAAACRRGEAPAEPPAAGSGKGRAAGGELTEAGSALED